MQVCVCGSIAHTKHYTQHMCLLLQLLAIYNHRPSIILISSGFFNWIFSSSSHAIANRTGSNGLSSLVLFENVCADSANSIFRMHVWTIFLFPSLCHSDVYITHFSDQSAHWPTFDIIASSEYIASGIQRILSECCWLNKHFD